MVAAAQTIASLCNNAALRRAARRLGQLFDDVLTPSGLRTTQHGLLAQIEVMGSPALGELAEIMVMDASALSHTLRPLTRDGLVSFVVDDSDRRRRRIVLTGAGKARLKQSTKLWSEAQARFERVFGVKRRPPSATCSSASPPPDSPRPTEWIPDLVERSTHPPK